MNISGFTTRAQQLVDLNMASIADEAARAGVSFGDHLSAVGNELDDLIKSGNEISRGLDARWQKAHDLLGIVDRGEQPRALPELVDEFLIPNADGSDEIATALQRVNAQGENFDPELDTRLAGALLLDPSSPEQTISAFREASTYWNQGMLAKQEAAIEQQLRATTAVNAEAAALLGQPVATAHIPISASRKGVQELTNLHVVPDRIVSPPNGFSDETSAREAASAYLATTPGVTLVSYTDSTHRSHLLSAPLDSSPRTIQRPKKFGKGKVAETAPVSFTGNIPSIWAIHPTGGQKSGGLTRGHAWPEGYNTPLTPDDLLNSGIALKHKSIVELLAKAEGKTNSARHEIDGLRDSLANQRVAVRNQKLNHLELQTVDDFAGRGTAQDWELEPMIHDSTTGAQEHIQFQPNYAGFTRMMEGAGVEDAIQSALLLKPEGSHSLTAILQDNAGTPHLAALDGANIKLQTGESLQIHNDSRAIVDHIRGGIWITKNPGDTASSQLSEFIPREDTPLNADAVYSALFDQVAPFGGAKRKFARYSRDAALRMLDETDLTAAASTIADEARQLDPSHAALLIVKVNHPSAPNRYAVIKSIAPNNTFKRWTRDYDFDRHSHERVMAAIDSEGVAFLRQDAKSVVFE